MQIDEVNHTARAVPEEIAQIRQAARRAAVRDRRRPQGDRSRKRLHEAPVRSDGGVDAHARALPRETSVRLVEAEERVGGVVRDAVGSVGGPDGGDTGAIVEEEWNEG